MGQSQQETIKYSYESEPADDVNGYSAVYRNP